MAINERKSFWEILAIVVTAVIMITALNSKAKDDTPVKQDQPAQTAPASHAKAEDAAAKARAVEPKRRDITVDDFTGMKLVYVPGGCFMMGSSTDDEDHRDDEGPAHEVCVDGFWMGQYEVTQGQWNKVIGKKRYSDDDYPVYLVSWYDAQDFIKKLNSRSGKNYRLPTEAEWEYACRAGGSDKYCGGDDLDVVAWHGMNSDDSTHSVGGKKENAFGLYDMSGNIWEWCTDWYASGYYASSPQDNPQGPDKGQMRVLRGGSWSHFPPTNRAVSRSGSFPEFNSDYIGFRLVLPLQ